MSGRAHDASSLIARATAALAGASLPDSDRAAATAAVRAWLSDPSRTWTADGVARLLGRGAIDELADCFRQELPFGTGGRRGPVGVGPNRINPWTVARGAQGHCDWLRDAGLGARGVVIGWDTRRFADVRGVYGGVPDGLAGITSASLAAVAAGVYAANGVPVWFPDPGTWLSTPLLSFAVRWAGADGGVMLSASHNPPDDCGVKVYDADGAQLVAPWDASLSAAIAAVGAVRSSSADARVLGPELVAAWIAAVTDGFPRTDLRVCFTPLHGTGAIDGPLAAIGCDVTRFAPQATPDGAFPTVPGHVANPERPEVLALACAGAGDADLVLATDPDGDRLGVAVRHDGAYQTLDGNEIAALVVDGALRRPFSRRPLVIRTRVTTSLVDRVAARAGAAVIGDLPVGFKHVAAVLAALERDGVRGALRADEVAFAAAVEESHGGLCTSAIRDKDAASAAVALVTAAAAARADGRTLIDLIRALRADLGEVRNGAARIASEGAAGRAWLARVLSRLSDDPPGALGDRAILGWDRDDAGAWFARLAGGAWDDGAEVAIRPSGTEPLLKIYAEVRGRPGLGADGCQAVRDAVDGLLAAARAFTGAC